MKEKLPREIALIFPAEVEHLIYTFLPHMPPKPPPNTPTFTTIKAFERLQSPKHPAMYMYGLEDFLLDGK